MKPGDWYLYCRDCGFTLGPNAASVTKCHCGSWLRIWRAKDGSPPPCSQREVDRAETLARGFPEGIDYEALILAEGEEQ